jgi:predicted permease
LENLLLSLNVVLPLFFLMAAGYVSRRIKLFDMKSHAVMNRLVFKLFLPLLLFSNVYHTSLAENIDGKVFVFSVAAIVAMFALLFIVIPIIEKENRRRGVLIQGIARSNFVIFGIPMATQLCGGEIATTSLLVAVVVPMFNVLSVVALEVYRGGRVSVKKILSGIVTNPLIISSMLGLVCLLTGVKLPTALDKAVVDLAGIATPFALYLLGASLEFSRVGANLKPLIVGLAGKLVVMPLMLISAAVMFGFRGSDLVALMVLFMAPTAVSSYTMAEQMGADGELAGQQVVFSTAFSIVTIFGFIFVAKTLGLI